MPCKNLKCTLIKKKKKTPWLHVCFYSPVVDAHNIPTYRIEGSDRYWGILPWYMEIEPFEVSITLDKALSIAKITKERLHEVLCGLQKHREVEAP